MGSTKKHFKETLLIYVTEEMLFDCKYIQKYQMFKKTNRRKTGIVTLQILSV